VAAAYYSMQKNHVLCTKILCAGEGHLYVTGIYFTRISWDPHILHTVNCIVVMILVTRIICILNVFLLQGIQVYASSKLAFLHTPRRFEH
jgi:hypothetical protein